MLTKAKTWLASHLAVVLVAIWAVWDILTAIAYIDRTPPQLEQIEAILHIPIWVVWAVTAGILLLGLVIPVRKGRRWRELATNLRGLGLVFSAALVGMWGLGFLLSDAERGWVSAKNYLLLTFMALHYGWIVSRHSMREG